MGVPWAGQDKLSGEEMGTSDPRTLAATDILGADHPIGSIQWITC